MSETLNILGLPHVFIPFSVEEDNAPSFFLMVKIQVPRGEAIARRTLNPRLGIVGGISILGTTGIVKPFSHKAYEETIDVALSVAESNGCKEIVLSTGGKSEHFAKSMLPHLRIEAFVQIADFFAYAVAKARDMGFKSIVHSAFFGKVVKMAQGHAYTHAHEVPLDLGPLARTAGTLGYDDAFCATLAASNTARHALEFLLASSATDVVQTAARQALEKSAHIAAHKPAVRLLLFDYDGKLLADQKTDP
jgi:cobalt-precorrin-5B (C1)-methyltransferase